MLLKEKITRHVTMMSWAASHSTDAEDGDYHTRG